MLQSRHTVKLCRRSFTSLISTIHSFKSEALHCQHRCSAGPGSSASWAAERSPARQVRVSHILIPPEQKDLLEELRSRVAAGEGLAALAAEHSQCPSKRQGGDIGWIGRGGTVAEFEEAAFGAAKGEVVTCATQFGLHLLMVTQDRQAAEVGMMTVQQLSEALAEAGADASETQSSRVQLIDVREEWEADVASLPGFRLLPLSRYDEWGPQAKTLLDPEAETAVLCHHGVRSQRVAQLLVDAGFKRVRNIAGGIDAYSRGVDPTVPTY